MRLIDPAFGRDNRALDLTRRLQALEKKMDEVQPQSAFTKALRAAMPDLPPPAIHLIENQTLILAFSWIRKLLLSKPAQVTCFASLGIRFKIAI